MNTQKYHRQLQFPDRLIEVRIIRQKRKTMAIHIFPGQKPVEVRVPMRCTWFDIETFLASRHSWIYDSLSDLDKLPIESVPEFKQSERHFFLGQCYALDLSPGRGSAHIKGDTLRLYCRDPDDVEVVRKQLENFYRKQSLPFFEKRLAICLANFPLKVNVSGLRVRKMRARWGSCSHKGEICLNTLLVQKPEDAIDFVIAHELCHLVHFRHDRAFYELLDRAMPNWREREKLLLRQQVKPDQLALLE